VDKDSQASNCPPAAIAGKSERAAVSKRHPMFGALKGLVLVAPGTDLTDPTDPDWGGKSEA
jgi:hypothetical protein